MGSASGEPKRSARAARNDCSTAQARPPRPTTSVGARAPSPSGSSAAGAAGPASAASRCSPSAEGPRMQCAGAYLTCSGGGGEITGVPVISHPDLRWRRCDVKSTNLLGNVLANQAAHHAGAFEAVLVDEHGVVTEATHSSLLLFPMPVK